MIPPEHNGDFVAQMEQVLEVYKRPYNSERPVVCMDGNGVRASGPVAQINISARR